VMPPALQRAGCRARVPARGAGDRNRGVALVRDRQRVRSPAPEALVMDHRLSRVEAIVVDAQRNTQVAWE